LRKGGGFYGKGERTAMTAVAAAVGVMMRLFSREDVRISGERKPLGTPAHSIPHVTLKRISLSLEEKVAGFRQRALCRPSLDRRRYCCFWCIEKGPRRGAWVRLGKKSTSRNAAQA